MAALDQATITTASESLPILISTGKTKQYKKGEKRLKPRPRFRLPLISEKGAILMIIWNLFFAISLFSCNILQLNQVVLAAVSFFLYPILGWLVDSKLGKYKVLQAALYFLLSSIILNNLSGLVFDDNKILLYSAAIVMMLCVLCYISSIIPFVLDQMVGASGEELSFTVYWLIWGSVVGWFISNSISKIGILPQTQSFIFLSITSASFLTAYVLLQYFSHFLNTKPQLSNPIKLVAQVLNYARKHHYPMQRSALTYWEEDYPSRMDLGKGKYGGPFTFEQVEDVKTVLRLLPLLATISVSTIGIFYSFQSSPCGSDSGILNSIFDNIFIDVKTLSRFLSTIAAVPVYHFIVYPFFYNCIPTLLRRIGLGIFLACIFCIAKALVQFVGTSQATTSDNVTCMVDFGFNPSSQSLSIFALIPMIFYMLSFPTLLYFAIELIIAQTPHQMKGLVLSIAIVLFYFTAILSCGTWAIFEFLPFSPYPNSHFYYYIVLFIITTIAFFLYLYFAKKYKLRVRDDIVPVHRLAEEYFEKEEKLRRAYWKEMGFEDSDESIG